MTNTTTMNDILTRLRNGESVEAIAAQFTKDINDANNKYQAEVEAKRKAEEEAKRKAAAAQVVRNDKIQAVDDLLNAIVDLLAAYEVGSAVLDAIEDIDPGQIVDEIDKAMPAIQEYTELMEAISRVRERVEDAPTPAGGRSMKAAPDLPAGGDPIEQFLNKFVRS